MADRQACPLQVWTARPADFGRTMPRDLDWLLDEAERERAARFKHEADLRSYVLGHALRRSVLARWLAIDPREIVFSQQPGGQPVLAAPREETAFFSHSCTRDAVACTVTCLAPVGIDVETAQVPGADEDLLARFVVPGDEGCPHEFTQDERSSRFHFYWTALEAFWKARGQGLADGNPRIEYRKNARGHFEVWLEGDLNAPHARLFPIGQTRGSAITLALRAPRFGSVDADVRPQLFNGNMQLFNSLSAHEMLSLR